jgi:hypothetical protein
MRAASLRTPGTDAEKRTLAFIRKRLREHGEAECRHMLAVAAADWLLADSQLRPKDWSAEDCLWNTNFDTYRRAQVGDAVFSKVRRQPRDNGLSDLRTADDFAAMQAELDARNHRA